MNRLFYIFVSAAFLVASCASASDVSERDALIASYLDWRGGSAFESVTSIVQEGTIEVSGLSGPVTSVQMRDGRSYLNVDLQIMEFTQVLNPAGSWQTNTSGQIEDLGSAADVVAQRALELEFAIPLLAPGENISLLGDEEKDGSNWAVLHILYESGDYRDLFIDEESGALAWSRVRQDTEVFWFHYTDWVVVDGVRLPGHQEEIHDVIARNAEITWTDNTLNTEIPEQIFDRPSEEGKMEIADGNATTGWMDFDYFRDSRIFMPTLLNGIATDSILDSGAGITVIDAALAEAAGIVGGGSLAASGTGGNTEVQIASGVSMTIGNLEIRDLTVAIMDMSALSTRLLGRPIPIILGKEVFTEMIVDVDYPNERIAFHDPDSWSYAGEGSVVPLLEHNDARIVPITVEGGDTIHVGFDIGQGSALTLFENYVNSTGLLDGRATTTGLGGGVGGAVLSTRTSVRSMTFGGVRFENVPASLALGAVGAFDTEDEQGNLGTGIFNRFRMIVNYPEDELYLELDETTVNAEFARDRAGIQVQIVGEMAAVTHVRDGSPAQNQGLAVGDVITSINGNPVRADYWSGNQWRWDQAPAGSNVELELDDGRVIELTLADFY